MVAIEIKDHFSDRVPKGYLQKIFYPGRYWQKQIKSLECQRSFQTLLEGPLQKGRYPFIRLPLPEALCGIYACRYAQSIGQDDPAHSKA